MSDDVWTCEPPTSGVVVTLGKPFVATMPGGCTVVLPVGTTMREVSQPAVETAPRADHAPLATQEECPGTGRPFQRDEHGIGRCAKCGEGFLPRGHATMPFHWPKGGNL